MELQNMLDVPQLNVEAWLRGHTVSTCGMTGNSKTATQPGARRAFVVVPL